MKYDLSRIYISLILAVCMTLPSPNSYSGSPLPHYSIDCGKGVEIKFRRSSSEENRKAYVADREDNSILFLPYNVSGKPEIILKLEFSEACLSLVRGEEFDDLEKHAILCESFDFLKSERELDHRDLGEFEEFLFAPNASRLGYNLSSIKRALSCLY